MSAKGFLRRNTMEHTIRGRVYPYAELSGELRRRLGKNGAQHVGDGTDSTRKLGCPVDVDEVAARLMMHW